jgi:hypothetical protein
MLVDAPKIKKSLFAKKLNPVGLINISVSNEMLYFLVCIKRPTDSNMLLNSGQRS